MAKSIVDVIEEKVMIDPNSGCWLWTGSISPQGYGRFYDASNPSERSAHRISYSYYIGTIPSGLDLDHKCRVRSCVNPHHLEPVTRSENLRRGIGSSILRKKYAEATHCRAGHEITTETSRMVPRKNKTPMRRCMICSRISGAKCDAKRRQRTK